MNNVRSKDTVVLPVRLILEINFNFINKFYSGKLVNTFKKMFVYKDIYTLSSFVF